MRSVRLKVGGKGRCSEEDRGPTVGSVAHKEEAGFYSKHKRSHWEVLELRVDMI